MLVFDFDGVLIDSLDEVVATSFNTATDRLITKLADLDPRYRSSFRLNRFQLGSAGDFSLLAEWCLDGLKAGAIDETTLLTPDELQQLRDGASESNEERGEIYFKKRAQFIEHSPQGWLDIHQTYQPIWAVLQQLPSEKILVVTNKNLEAVKTLTEHFGLKLKEENIYAADAGRTKFENFKLLHEKYQPEVVTFLEDSIRNLHGLLKRELPFTLKPVLADWGYLGPDDKTFADTLGIPTLSLAESERFIQRQLD